MFKFVFLLIASTLLVEGSPTFPSAELADAARNGKWDLFHALFQQQAQSNLSPVLTGSVESLKPDGNSHVYGHAISTFKEWHNDNGNVTSKSGGLEVTNNDGDITRRTFQP